MKKYKVEVRRTEYCYKTVFVEANSIEEAESLAIDKSYDLVFDSGNAYYEIDDIPTEEIKNQ